MFVVAFWLTTSVALIRNLWVGRTIHELRLKVNSLVVEKERIEDENQKLLLILQNHKDIRSSNEKKIAELQLEVNRLEQDGIRAMRRYDQVLDALNEVKKDRDICIKSMEDTCYQLELTKSMRREAEALIEKIRELISDSE